MSTYREWIEYHLGVWPLPVSASARSIGVQLLGDDGQPFHCGVRMQTYAGIVGTDYVICGKCGAKMWRIDSPHTNGGKILAPDVYDEMGDCVWIAQPGKVLP